MFNKIKNELINFGLKLMSIDDKIARMFLETAPSNINEIIIMPASKIFARKILNKLRNKRSHGRVYNGLLNDINVSVIRSLVGCPMCAITVESLKRCNTKIIIRVDFCGGIQDDTALVDVGDILLPKLAYCGDGTSPQYIIKYSELLNHLKSVPNPFSKVHEVKTGNQNVFITKPNEELKNILLNEGNSIASNNIKEVDFWTTDSLFCETKDFINGLKSINVKGIDMESSILFLLGMIYKLKTVSILSVSDLPGHSKYDMFKTNEIHPSLIKGIDIAINLVISALPKIKKLI